MFWKRLKLSEYRLVHGMPNIAGQSYVLRLTKIGESQGLDNWTATCMGFDTNIKASSFMQAQALALIWYTKCLAAITQDALILLEKQCK